MLLNIVAVKNDEKTGWCHEEEVSGLPFDFANCPDFHFGAVGRRSISINPPAK
jgi:hypothetical protein